MIKSIIELGTIIKDVPSDISGMLIILMIDDSNNEHYLFQPSMLNPETKQPVESFWVGKSRIQNGNTIQVDIPLEILGTLVEDKATGFSGTATAIEYHLNGCTHFSVKPKGVIKSTGEAIKSREFDIRRLKGKAITQLTKEQLEKSKIDTPSPEYKPNLFP